jgi:hypothetical protein
MPLSLTDAHLRFSRAGTGSRNSGAEGDGGDDFPE